MTQEQKEKRAEHCRQVGYKCKKYNEYEIVGEVAYVKMTNTNNVMICDKAIWEQWKNYGWFEHRNYHYALGNINGKKVRFHQLVIPKREDYLIDHINRNRLDNRRENLRYATAKANNLNTNLSKRNKSGHKGVCQNKKGKWKAYMWIDYKAYSLGTYNTKEEAIEARELAEKNYINPILENETCN